jgi:hypothetical protein
MASMKTSLTIAATAAIMIFAAGATPSFAKAHDNGVSNPANGGTAPAGGRGNQSAEAPAVGQGGIGAAVNDGKRGEAASAAGSDNSRAGGVSGQR